MSSDMCVHIYIYIFIYLLLFCFFQIETVTIQSRRAGKERAVIGATVGGSHGAPRVRVCEVS